MFHRKPQLGLVSAFVLYVYLLAYLYPVCVYSRSTRRTGVARFLLHRSAQPAGSDGNRAGMHHPAIWCIAKARDNGDV